METETNMPARTVRLIRHPSGVYAIETADRDGRIFLRPDELADVVQQAYDEHGILAAPSYDTEAQLVPEWLHQKVAETVPGGKAAVHALAMAHNAGVRA